MQATDLKRLGNEIIDLTKALNTQQARLLQLVSTFDANHGYALTGATSTVVWLAHVAGMEHSTAREHVRVARALRQLPHLTNAFASGELSYSKVRILTRTANPDNEHAMIELGRTHSADGIAKELARQLAEDLTPEELAATQHEARGCSSRTDADGTVVFTLRTTPGTGAEIQARIDARMMTSHASAGASHYQQQHDAIASILTADSTTGGTVAHAEVVLHVHGTEHGDFMAVTEDGTPVPMPEVEQFATRAQLRVLFWDTQNNPIDASHARKRPTIRQKRVIKTRDNHKCSYPGCTARAFIDVHHKQPREHGGPTTLTNLQNLCGYHHKYKHRPAA